MKNARILLIVLLILAAGWMAWLAVFQVDDAFIVYRYARNLAHGNGFVFNPGERVEGVTCFLWTLMLVPFSAAGFYLPRVAPVLTAIAGLCCLVVVARRHAESEGRARLSLRDVLAPSLLAVSPAFAYWSVGALETVPYALLVALAVRQHAREREGATGYASAVFLGIAGLVRPEAPLVVAVLAADRLTRHRLGAVLRWLGVIGAFIGPFVLFRKIYFGRWLPNTYYAKTGDPLFYVLAKGWKYTSGCVASLVPAFGLSGGAVIVLGFILLAALLTFAWRRSALRAEAIVVATLLFAGIVEGGDWMVLWRFSVPALPCLAVIAGAALLSLSARGRAGRLAAGAIMATVVASGLTAGARERNGGHGLVVNAAGYRHAHREIARYLNEHAAPGDVVALMDVGMIGWDAERLVVIDTTGLTDRAIAEAPGGFLDKRYPVDDLLARDPRFIVLVPAAPIDRRIFSHPAFMARYTALFSVDHRFNWTPPSTYKLWLFERKPG